MSKRTEESGEKISKHLEIIQNELENLKRESQEENLIEEVTDVLSDEGMDPEGGINNSRMFL